MSSEKPRVTLHKSMIRSQSQYAHVAWNTYTKGIIKDATKVQMGAAKLTVSMKNLSYVNRLIHFKIIWIPTMKFKQIRGNMTEQ